MKNLSSRPSHGGLPGRPQGPVIGHLITEGKPPSLSSVMYVFMEEDLSGREGSWCRSKHPDRKTSAVWSCIQVKSENDNT